MLTERSRPTFHIGSFFAEKMAKELNNAALEILVMSLTADGRLWPVICQRKDLTRALFIFVSWPRTDTSKQKTSTLNLTERSFTSGAYFLTFKGTAKCCSFYKRSYSNLTRFMWVTFVFLYFLLEPRNNAYLWRYLRTRLVLLGSYFLVNCESSYTYENSCSHSDHFGTCKNMLVGSPSIHFRCQLDFHFF